MLPYYIDNSQVVIKKPICYAELSKTAIYILDRLMTVIQLTHPAIKYGGGLIFAEDIKEIKNSDEINRLDFQSAFNELICKKLVAECEPNIYQINPFIIVRIDDDEYLENTNIRTQLTLKAELAWERREKDRKDD